jgi:hypothetical protein
VTENVVVSIPQLSVILPPPEINEVYVFKIGGIDPIHSNVRFEGQVITGKVLSSTVMV